MSNTKQQIDDFFGDFEAPVQEKPLQIEEPEVQEVKKTEVSPVDIYAKWVSDYEQSRL